MGQAVWTAAALLLSLVLATAPTPITSQATPVVLRPSTGMVVPPSPLPPPSSYVFAANGTRYNGTLNPDPQARPQVQGLYEQLPQDSDVVGVHLIHVPNTDKYLYMERPSQKRSVTRQIAGTFDLVTREWVRVTSLDGLFCAGHTITSEGAIVVAGGHKATGGYPSGLQSVRIFDINENPTLLQNETVLRWPRWYPTLTLLPDNQVMIMGGTQQVGGSGNGNRQYELYAPNTNATEYPLDFFSVEDTFYAQMKKMYYPFNFVLPTGDVYSFGEREARIMVAQTGVYRRSSNTSFLMGQKLIGTNFTQFPFTATGAFGMLTYENNYTSVDFMIFGGAPVDSTQQAGLVANQWVRRNTISWAPQAGSNSSFKYSFTDWTTEDLHMPRVMGDATILPNGDVVLLNGAQIGVAGDSSSGNNGQSDYPNFWAQLYQPDMPINQRITNLAGSKIARMYHSTACLTTNATILVTGCDRCFQLDSDVPGYVTPTSRWEYRNEIFYPPYYYDTDNQPRIITVNNVTVGNITLAYDQEFTLQWTGANGNGSVPVTMVTLYAPCSVTHSVSTNQRVVKLRITSVDYTTNTMTVRTPTHPYIAVPQYYMLFALNGKTPSQARWIKLVDTRKEGMVVPK